MNDRSESQVDALESSRKLVAVLVLLISPSVVGCGDASSETGERPAEVAGLPDVPFDLDGSAKVRRDDGGGLIEVDFRGVDVTDDAIAALSGSPTLKAVRFSGKNSVSELSPASIGVLARLPALKVLAADFMEVDDADIASIADAGRLTELYLAGTDISDSVSDSLVKLPRLRRLRLSQTDIAGETCAVIATLGELRELDLSGCPRLTDASMASIGKVDSLTKLNVYDTPIGPESLDELTGLDELAWLNLDKTQIDDSTVAALADLKSLKFLHLGSTAVSDAAVPALRRLSGLDELIVTRTKLTEAAAERLRASLPGTKITSVYQPAEP